MSLLTKKEAKADIAVCAFLLRIGKEQYGNTKGYNQALCACMLAPLLSKTFNFKRSICLKFIMLLKYSILKEAQDCHVRSVCLTKTTFLLAGALVTMLLKYLIG